MASTATLTSLAILKVNLDRGKDYLEYLRPFILQVIVDLHPESFSEGDIGENLRSKFGLEIPERTIEILLRRLSRSRVVKKAHRVYRVSGNLPDPQITVKTSEARRHIDSVVTGLQQFSQDTVSPFANYDEAVVAICTFLAEFDVSCLSAYLRGTTIPQNKYAHSSDIVLVSEYVQHIQKAAPERFNSFLVLVQGHMLANALLCPDLINASQTFKKVTFFLDTPLLIQVLGLEGISRQSAICEMISLLLKLDGVAAVFSHTRRELEAAISTAAAKLDSPTGWGSIIQEARSEGTSKSDLQLITESLDEKLGEFGITVIDTPKLTEEFQIDESIFEQVLDDELSYRHFGAKANDIKSVRSIYVLRGDRSAPSLEKCKAVLVTSNEAFAKAAWQYGKERESSRDVSVVMSDFSITNIAWLKAPVGAPEIPQTQLLAFSYAALKPSSQLLSKFMDEIDKLLARKSITERDHQLLRSSPKIVPELMRQTLGEVSNVNEGAVQRTHERVTADITKEASEKLEQEQDAHHQTRVSLDYEMEQNEKFVENLYWQCQRDGSLMAKFPLALLAIVLILGTLFGLGVHSTNPVVGGVLTLSFAVVSLLSLLSLFFGSTLKSIHSKFQHNCSTWLFKRRAKSLGLDISKLQVE